MKVLHTIPSMGINSGGPSLSTLLTLKGIRECGIEAQVVTYDVFSPADSLITQEPFIRLLPPANNKFAYSRSYKDFLLTNNQYDIYHAQGIWLYPTYITAKLAQKNYVPYIITPRGMLYPQDLAKGKLKKAIFLKLFLLNDLQKAACVHATCMEEMRHIRRLGVKSPVAVIPNPIDTTGMEQPILSQETLRMGYLGRVHPRKNIERLLYAWNKLGNKTRGSELVIIGDGDKVYLDFLKKETERLQLQNVVFTGFLSGETKEAALGTLSYLAVPSDFENFGMIVAEALVRGIPVIASTGTPWEELNTRQCGWHVNNDVETLTATMEKALAVPANERIAMGQRGKELIKNNYSVEIVGRMMVQLYEWVLDGGEKPGFVYL